MARTYVVTAPATPGARPTERGRAGRIAEARRIADEVSRGRPDLRGQDVRIEDGATGHLVEYAGPCR